MLFKANACAALLLLTAGIGHADIFTFSYQASTGVIAGSFNGTLQGDNNTFLITSVIPTATFAGTAGTPLTFVDSFSNYTLLSGIPATLTLDGSFFDVITCPDSACNDGFLFVAGGLFGLPGHFSSGPTYGDLGEDFDVSKWSASVSTPTVPEPGSILLLLSAVGVVGRRLMRPRPS